MPEPPSAQRPAARAATAATADTATAAATADTAAAGAVDAVDAVAPLDAGRPGPRWLLLHGLGTTSDTWRRLVACIGRDRPDVLILCPDLPGHGRAPLDPPYGYSRHAAAVAAGLAPGTELVVIGHSMGAMVGLALAAGDFGIRVAGIIGFSVKLAFTRDDHARMHKLGRQPARWFDARDDALDRYLLVAGLAGLVDRHDPIASAGIVSDGGRHRLAVDPRVHLGVGAPAAPFVRAMTAPLRLIAGSDDPMVSIDDMRRLDPDALLLDGLGHNPHVQAPERLWSVIGPLAAAMSPSPAVSPAISAAICPATAPTRSPDQAPCTAGPSPARRP